MQLYQVIVEKARHDGEGFVFAVVMIGVIVIPAVLFSIAGAIWIILRAAMGDFN